MRITILIVCLLLAGCTDFDQERALASKNLQMLKGQPVQVLMTKLGPPNLKSAGKKGRFYAWTASKDFDESAYTQDIMTVGGKPVSINSKSSGLIKHESCAIVALTDFNDIIVRSFYRGHGKGACMTYFDKLKEVPGSKKDYPLFP